MYSVNIFMRKDGLIYQNKENLKVDGAILSISNQSMKDRGTRITCSTIEYPRILTGDQCGNVYLFDLQKNRFNCLYKIGNCCTAIAFAKALCPERDVLVATSNCYLYVIQSLSGNVVSRLLGHETSISHISVDKKGYVAVTSSIRKTVVWNLQALTKMHEIIPPFEVDLVKSMLVPPMENILSIFKKGKICSWNHKTREYDQFCDLELMDKRNYLEITTADVSSDGKLLLVGGRSSWLLLWELDLVFEKLGSVISLSNEISSAVRVAFLNFSGSKDSSKYLAVVLSSAGAIYLYDITNNLIISKMKIPNDKIISMHCSSAKVVAITLSGLVKVYNMENLLPDKIQKNEGRLFYQSKEKSKSVSVKELQVKKDKSQKLSIMTMERLKGVLKEYGVFPDKYRLIVWSNFLELPDNYEAFKLVYNKGVLDAYKDLEKKVPVLSKTLFRSLQLVLSMCGHWCPQLIEIDFIPSLIFPFVKLLHQNLHLCFEVVLAFLCKWANNWFINYPYPSAFIIIASENILKEHETDLLLHLVRHGIAAQLYVWALLSTMFSEVFMKMQWIQLLDHVIANPPDFLLYLVISFSIASKKSLLKCNSMETFEAVYTTPAPDDILNVTLKTAYRIYRDTPCDIKEKAKASMNVDHIVSYGKYGYPVITNFPTMVLDINAEKKQSLEELMYMKSRQELLLKPPKSKNEDKNDKECTSTKCSGYKSDKGKIIDLDIVKSVMATRAQIANVQMRKYSV